MKRMKGASQVYFEFSYPVDRATTVKRRLAAEGVSHRLLAKLFAAGAVRKNGQVTGNQPVLPGDEVGFTMLTQPLIVQSHQPLVVVKETRDWLIVDKSVGMASVPGPSDPTHSLLNAAAGYLAEQGVTAPQPAVITRLDRDTCGLVLLAKHPFAQGKLDQLGVDATVTKIYRAVVEGQLDPPAGRIDRPLAKAPDGIHRRVDPAGVRAVTDYRTLTLGATTSLVEARLETGRTHQIRVHFASLGHALVGDPLYGQGEAGAHQLLQASKLAFTDPFSAGVIEAELPLPEEFSSALR